MRKTEVYSWRLTPALKAALEDAARGTGQSVGSLLEGIVKHWIERGERRRTRNEESEEDRRRSAAIRFVGAIAGANPGRAENARQAILARLRRKHAR